MGRESRCIPRRSPGLVCGEPRACRGLGYGSPQSRAGWDATRVPQASWAPDATQHPLGIPARRFGAGVPRGYGTARVPRPTRGDTCTHPRAPPDSSAVPLRARTFPKSAPLSLCRSRHWRRRRSAAKDTHVRVLPVLRAGCSLSWGVALNQSHFKTLIISTKASPGRCWLQFRPRLFISTHSKEVSPFCPFLLCPKKWG